MFVDRSRHRYDVDVGGFEIFNARGIAKLGRLFQFLAAYFQGVVLAILEFGDPLLVNIKTDNRAFFPNSTANGRPT